MFLGYGVVRECKQIQYAFPECNMDSGQKLLLKLLLVITSSASNRTTAFPAINSQEGSLSYFSVLEKVDAM